MIASNPLGRDDLVAVVAQGIRERKGPREIADDLGVSPAQVYRVADAAGLAIRRGKITPPPTLRRVIRDMKPVDALEFVLEAYEQLVGESEGQLVLLANMGMTNQQARIYALLDRNKGRIVTHDMIADAASHVSHKGAVSNATIKVQVHRLREIIEHWPVRIVTVWGTGYRLEDKA